MTTSSEATRPFELVTWYDTWNEAGLQNLQNGRVPLGYATRYNLAFGHLAEQADGAYSVVMEAFAAQVKDLILQQAPTGVKIYASTRPPLTSGIADAVDDNRWHDNRSTTAIVAWLKANGYGGLVIDEEDPSVMWDSFLGRDVPPHFVEQLGPSFKKAGLEIIVSAPPVPYSGPSNVYGPPRAVELFMAHVAAIELQDYSDHGTIDDANKWIVAGIPAEMLLGGSGHGKESHPWGSDAAGSR